MISVLSTHAEGAAAVNPNRAVTAMMAAELNISLYLSVSRRRRLVSSLPKMIWLLQVQDL